jgi:hypothetical protein
MFDDFDFGGGLGDFFGGGFGGDMPGLGGGAPIFQPVNDQPAQQPQLVADASGAVPGQPSQPVQAGSPAPAPSEQPQAAPVDNSPDPTSNPGASSSDYVAAAQKRLGITPQAQQQPSAAPAAGQSPMASMPKDVNPAPPASIQPPDPGLGNQPPSSSSRPPASSAPMQASSLMAAPARTPNLTGVDPRLQDIVSNGATYLPDGYSVKVNEGYNPNGHVANSQHHIEGAGALDIQIFGPDGKAIPNSGDDSSGLYTKLAQGAYTYQQSAYPDLNGKLAWGGAFETSPGSGRPDLMHFDLGGERGHFTDNLPSRLGPLGDAPRASTAQASSGAQGDYGGYLGNLTQKYSLPDGYLSRTATLESNGNPNDVSKTGAAGVFQFTKGTAKDMGVQDRFDPYQSADGAARYAAQNQTALTQSLGRAPTGGELYLAHQQGAGDPAALLKNPDMNVVDALAPAYGGSRAGAREAVEVNGGNANMTAGEFASKWTSAYDGAKPTYALASSSGPKSDQEYRDMYPNAVGLNSSEGRIAYMDANGKEHDSAAEALAVKKTPGLGQQLAQRIAKATDDYAKAAFKQQGRPQAPKMTPAKAPRFVDPNIREAKIDPLPMNWQG